MRIIKAGIQDTIQDIGRYGNQHQGINPSGAMDKYAMQIINALVGNNAKEAVLEMHFPAATIMFSQSALIALGGADFSPTINGEPVPSLHPIIVNKNDILQFHKPIAGARVYLAIAGGISVKSWMDSRTTNLKAKVGGFNGRKLQKDDHVLFRLAYPYPATQKEFSVLPWKADIKIPSSFQHEEASQHFYILPGFEWSQLTTESKEQLTTNSFELSQQSDRMGYRLNNIPLTTTTKDEVISSAVSFGTIQLLPDGKLIILMADHQTTGGYPRVGHIISAHHTKLAQLKGGDKIQFRLTDLQNAEDLFINQQQHLLQLQNACSFRLKEYFKQKN